MKSMASNYASLSSVPPLVFSMWMPIDVLWGVFILKTMPFLSYSSMNEHMEIVAATYFLISTFWYTSISAPTENRMRKCKLKQKTLKRKWDQNQGLIWCPVQKPNKQPCMVQAFLSPCRSLRKTERNGILPASQSLRKHPLAWKSISFSS